MKNFILVLVSILASLLLAEWISNRILPTEYMKPGAYEQQSARLHQASSVPGLDYEPRPDTQLTRNPAYAIWKTITIETNSFGMRSAEPVAPGIDGICTIAVLGDSFTFGMSIDQEQIYPNILESAYRQRHGEQSLQVLNFGVKGYGTREELLVLKYKALDWDPDLVIIGYYLNDPELRYPWNLQNYFRKPQWWQYSNILRNLAKVREGRKILEIGGGDYFKYLHFTEGEPWESVAADFREIGQLAKENDFPVLLVIFPHVTIADWPKNYLYAEIHAQVTREAEKHNFAVLDLFDAYSIHAAKNLIVEPGDAHPSPLGHSIAGTRIFSYIEDRGLLACP